MEKFCMLLLGILLGAVAFGQSPAITMKTSLPLGSEISFFIATDTFRSIVKVDFGNGILTDKVIDKNNTQVTGILKGYQVSIYGERITEFKCTYSQLTALDVSNCKHLKCLLCCFNQLHTLNVSANKKLEILDCSSNRLTALDVSQNGRLTEFDCSSNLFTSLETHKANTDKEMTYKEILIFYLSLISLLILVFFVYKHQKTKRRQILLQTRLNEATRKIDFKNRELTNKVMHLTRQEHVLSGIKEQLIHVNMENKKSKETVSGILTNIDILLRQSPMGDFEKYFIEVHPDFFTRLKHKYPELSSTDLKICAFLRLNLSTKEIASLTNKSIRSIENSRTNIRKKMKLSKENLYDTLAIV